ncbi:prephenate dehydratase [Schumannella sp. 10F1B-5-1]|uniref:prephenate dehydratase n=1 Tax=Schumannella sp. 10F1B-5-1 TaxID=2590780 RepID=UPI0011305DD6|nr:prephenate dehydratase [Schumannella sp. 10F1B-5-1]TPW78423.1 prephenate dehydratase [Schumannella sp. 10F1B-5-1]
MPAQPSASPVYSYLGPVGTFTWSALNQAPEAAGAEWRSVNNVGEALDDVTSGRSVGAMIAIENSVEGGVSATQDALAAIPGVRITGEYLVRVDFDLVARPGTALADVTTVAAHPVAYAQTHRWLDQALPKHAHLPATSNVAAPRALLADSPADAAIAPHGITQHLELATLAEHVGDNATAVTRFIMVTRSGRIPERTGADKTSIIVELPSDRAGSLLDMLEQFATRGVNMSLLESRPIGDELGRYRFNIDLDGHVRDERVADALLGLKRFSPRVTFLGSYPRADGRPVEHEERYRDEVFIEARDWLRGILSGEPATEHGTE